MEVVLPGRRCEAGAATPTNPDRSIRMNGHENARMVVDGRVLLARRVTDEGRRVAEAAQAATMAVILERKAAANAAALWSVIERI